MSSDNSQAKEKRIMTRIDYCTANSVYFMGIEKPLLVDEYCTRGFEPKFPKGLPVIVTLNDTNRILGIKEDRNRPNWK